MKKTIFTSVCSLALVGASSGYTISFVNIAFANDTAVPVLDNTGAPIAFQGGYVGAGTFSALPSSAAEVESLFTVFGSGGSFQNDFAAPGFFNNTASVSIPQGTVAAPVGESLFIVIGNGDSITTSTQLAVFDTLQVIGTENASGLGGIAVTIDSTTLTPERLLVGSIQNGVDTGLGVVFSEGIQLAPIPEPSTSLLAALAGLGLVARRRR